MARISRELFGYGLAGIGIVAMVADCILSGGILSVAGMTGLAVLLIGAVIANC